MTSVLEKRQFLYIIVSSYFFKEYIIMLPFSEKHPFEFVCQEGVFLNPLGLDNSDSVPSQMQVQPQSVGPSLPGLVNQERDWE